MFFEYFPVFLISELFGEWISYQDLVYFDYSCCNHKIRSNLKEFLQTFKPEFIKRRLESWPSIPEANWLSKRGHNVRGVKVFDSSAPKELEQSLRNLINSLNVNCVRTSCTSGCISADFAHPFGDICLSLRVEREDGYIEFDISSMTLKSRNISYELHALLLAKELAITHLSICATEDMGAVLHVDSIIELLTRNKTLSQSLQHFAFYGEHESTADLTWIAAFPNLTSFTLRYECEEDVQYDDVSPTCAYILRADIIQRLHCLETDHISYSRAARALSITYSTENTAAIQLVLENLCFKPLKLVLIDFADAAPLMQWMVSNRLSAEATILHVCNCRDAMFQDFLSLLRDSRFLTELHAVHMTGQCLRPVLEAVCSSGACRSLRFFLFRRTHLLSFDDYTPSLPSTLLAPLTALTSFRIEWLDSYQPYFHQFMMCLVRNENLTALTLPFNILNFQSELKATSATFHIAKLVPFRFWNAVNVVRLSEKEDATYWAEVAAWLATRKESFEIVCDATQAIPHLAAVPLSLCDFFCCYKLESPSLLEKLLSNWQNLTRVRVNNAFCHVDRAMCKVALSFVRDDEVPTVAAIYAALTSRCICYSRYKLSINMGTAHDISDSSILTLLRLCATQTDALSLICMQPRTAILRYLLSPQMPSMKRIYMFFLDRPAQRTSTQCKEKLNTLSLLKQIILRHQQLLSFELVSYCFDRHDFLAKDAEMQRVIEGRDRFKLTVQKMMAGDEE